MRVHIVYAIIYGSLLGFLLLWRIVDTIDKHLHNLLSAWIRKRFIYTTVVQRRRGTQDVCIITALLITIYVAANLFCLTFENRGPTELAGRASFLFAINALLMYLGVHLSTVLDKLLGLSLRHKSVAHRWIGRICVLHATVHGVSQIAFVRRSSMSSSMIIVSVPTQATLSKIIRSPYLYSLLWSFLLSSPRRFSPFAGHIMRSFSEYIRYLH